LERNLIIERVRAGMRRARLEGQHIGRNHRRASPSRRQSGRCGSPPGFPRTGLRPWGGNQRNKRL
jgi:hypothetical protein